MKTLKETTIAALFFSALLGLSIFTWAIGHRAKRNIPVVKHIAVKPRMYNMALLKKLEQLLVTLDFSRPSFEYKGKFNVLDGKDSANNVHDLRFLFCRSGNTYYSKLGNVETINENGVNVYIEHDMKRVIISNMQYPVKPGITDLSKLLKTLRSEDYALESSVSGTVKKISLLNEHHITCKELSVTYDTVADKLNNFLVRYTDITDPLNDKKDRRVEVDFSQITNDGSKKDHPAIADIITDKDGKPALLPKFSTYELIKL